MPLSSLVSPIPGDDPGGIDLTFLPEFDAIQQARRADDPSLDQGDWARELKTADWPLVSRLCNDALCRQTKDLRIAGWYLEAQVQLEGIRGLAMGYRLIATVCASLWNDLHPRDDDNEERLGCLRWVISQSPRWIRAAGSGESDSETVEACRTAVAALDELDRALEVHVAGEGPSLTTVRDMLKDLEAAYGEPSNRPDNALSDDTTASNDLPASDSSGTARARPPLPPAARPQTSASTFETRDEALECLRQVAHYFRDTEPHSPVAYLADKAARWGNMPLHEWLQQVLGEGDALVRMRDILDIPGDRNPA